MFLKTEAWRGALGFTLCRARTTADDHRVTFLQFAAEQLGECAVADAKAHADRFRRARSVRHPYRAARIRHAALLGGQRFVTLALVVVEDRGNLGA